jgi:hypothetical protein
VNDWISAAVMTILIPGDRAKSWPPCPLSASFAEQDKADGALQRKMSGLGRAVGEARLAGVGRVGFT